MGLPTIEKREKAMATLSRIAQGQKVLLDTWDGVTLLLYIRHLLGEAEHWADMYNREALRYAGARPPACDCGAIDEDALAPHADDCPCRPDDTSD